MSASSPALSYRELKHRAVGRFVIGLSAAARSVPPSLASRFGAALGTAFYFASTRYRTVALRNLRRCFGEEWSDERIRETARETFRNLGRTTVEFLRQPLLSDDDILRLTRYEGREFLDAAVARGKGVIVVTGHFGNWELMASRLVLDGYKMSVVARDADDPRANRMINGIREGRGYRVISRSQGPRPLLAALKRNEIIGILMDQNQIDGVFVPFFGRLASTAPGPAALARATGAAVVPGFCIRQPDDTHVIQARPSLDLRSEGDKEADILNATAALTRVIEDAVREHPTQWLWIHDRWKKRPPEESASPALQEASPDPPSP